MRRKDKELPILEKLSVIDAGAEGKAIARFENRVVFIPFAAPGDVVDVQVTLRKSTFMEAKIIKIHEESTVRTKPACRHYGLCGGCRWQHLDYKAQLQYKQKQVTDALTRIGHLELPEISPIAGAPATYYYRNKLEYTFSNRKWLTGGPDDIAPGDRNMNALGYHLPGMFDRVFDVEDCMLQPEPSNQLRLWMRDFAIENELTFWDVKIWQGLLRNFVIRTSNSGDLMVIIVFGEDQPEAIHQVMENLTLQFPTITSAMWVVNTKRNDVFADLDIQLFKGESYIREKMEDLTFRVGPVSFFQTNARQALTLYKYAREFAALTGNELVYDLYTGTGTIANFVARRCHRVVGIEYVDSAVRDARINSSVNRIENTDFIAGDMAKTLDERFILKHGRPQVVITDPPRAGMHPDVVKRIVEMSPERVVYISCNPATQARDIAQMADQYSIAKVQPVDMFPQTHHVENVVLLLRKS
ncbi:MAG TPA: 23S rRNA (uracil(1939)-C(5))-methyltransferase RlmD [Bacteroidales bacterium]|nr:MAG: 23S rRNA (uracil-5-)-methyltransferase RumA [Bacteroidetes bacterium GWE2_42_24]OFY30951.1 MAG: 23S rRNA (uracil-5-)-methyltransferase RumA [Bacteroidetes bacterium GWF2_43_11]HBZ66451.1 23S rRNA (uracil(1939)-C(5))-methyltransferase RlmD [Bacteroidales bacterium]